ncbi:aspartate/glutamate racemase family protein [Phreatobacter cathodiphilus]|uniref:Asp/Glu/hydantoin racemase n=1 Tax=Phreatobacter cathodiphilus TaxID=1868589 RepID=A0A2S0NG14_9HYPH|nr:aspartate/glutamate racemase family protein [Phreatobacter cathodiphilus]AVO47102.1 Asp/Glu/hydantoin racemase [Phreatobacter cathodiphilus]
MRLLIANPNTSATVTDRLMAAAAAVKAPGTELVPMTAPRGVPYIATRADAVVGAGVALDMLAEAHEGVDAAVIAAFGDPGLGGARELFDIPVVGMAEAAMLTACMLGRSFAIVTFSGGLVPWYHECLDWNGLRGRCAGIFALQGAFTSLADVQEEKEAALVDLANRVVAEHEADVVILAGAPLSGLAQTVRDRVPVPLVDGIQAAVKQAEALAALKPAKATTGTFRRPAAKTCTGISEPLRRRFEHRDRPDESR